ncbi:hypothetical protein C8F04DRAFT_1089811 [Mycena alexandri]|uniref:Homeobox domain-containing protein n=1 Tax=Mycena alexandri TaxID=1745969 RepID=A0AAD6T1N1_9AGAR|nr:hypothetical protein C8F04DRAFT_1089811 [Mycena alexandri]
MPPTKRGRHRHSPVQLAALNELWEETEHPSLAQRTALAASIGLPPTSVNSYFQNSRAKKRPRGLAVVPSSSAPAAPAYPDIKADDVYIPPTIPSFPNPADSLSESESRPHRMRPSLSQVDELEKSYISNPHPTVDEMQLMAESIGIRYQSVTNWFQRQEQVEKSEAAPEDGDVSRPFPPAPDQPSLTERGRRASSFAADDGLVSRSRRASSRRSATPYSSSSAVISLSARQRRARPEPVQLDALKRLFNKTPTPTIEERSTLAVEIGMEIGKVTNWFRNLRQSARKREKKVGRRGSGGASDDDMDYTDGYGTPSASASASRAGTPSSSLERGDGRRRHLRPRMHSSDEDDEEDDEDPQEAVTPSPSQSPSPTSSPSLARVLDYSVAAALQDAMAQMAKEDKFKDLAADALLLLEFQATCR